jgi:uncharacterized repeat protein (TIGR03803 family)
MHHQRRFTVSSKLRNYSWHAAFAAALLALVICGAAIPAKAQTYTVVHSFNSAVDGANPSGGVIQENGGLLAGSTSTGGSNGGGTVFTLSTGGTLTTLHAFCAIIMSSVCQDGNDLEAGLSGSYEVFVYGVTASGGANNLGTFFKIGPSPDGLLTTFVNFSGASGPQPGADPVGTPFHYGISGGNFYGTTQLGGASNLGTIFVIAGNGDDFTSLHSFSGPDGEFPVAALAEGSDGNIYGTTSSGGANGDGTVFQFNITSNTLTTLYSFCSSVNCTDGKEPMGALVPATDGNLYGTTLSGGAHNRGTVFKITLGGALNVVYSFCSKTSDRICTDGSSPQAGIIQANDGSFYGTTSLGGTASTACTQAQKNGCGTIFKLTSSGALTTLYNFCEQTACTDGNVANAPLFQYTSGVFYGTTEDGGANGDGTVFSLSTDLGSFLIANPPAGPEGAGVKILGSKLDGATSVTFNGTAATFTVMSNSEILTNVPAGATTGTLQVVTPGAPLSTIVPFTVTPKG